jgi:hypothetical protein
VDRDELYPGCSPPRLAATQLPSVTECQNTPARTFTSLIRCNYRRTSVSTAHRSLDGGQCPPYKITDFYRSPAPSSTRYSLPAARSLRSVFWPEGQVIVTLSACSFDPSPKVSGSSTDDR